MLGELSTDLGLLYTKFKLKCEDSKNIKADCVKTVVLNLHQIKRRTFFLGHPADLLQDLGFSINWGKSILMPNQFIEYLGFVIDSQRMMFFLSESKVLQIQSEANKLLCSRTAARQLASFMDLCQAAVRAVRIAPLHLRNLQRV